MKEKDKLHFFESLGEILRDITAIEFLMRCAIAKKDQDINLLPQPPYTKNKVYKNYPNSFSKIGFGNIANEFNSHFPEINIPIELVQLRNAMAHGIISEINKSGVGQLVKFKESKNKEELVVEFSIPLGLKKLSQIRQSLKELRRHVMQVSKD